MGHNLQATVNAEISELSRIESEPKLRALRCKLTERRSQIDDQLRELKEQRRQIDELLILTDDRKLNRQKKLIQETLVSAPDIHSGDILDFLKLVEEETEDTLLKN